MYKALLVFLFLFSYQNNFLSQGMWHQYEIDQSSYLFGESRTVEELKNLIINDNNNSPLGHYSSAAKYLYYKHKGSEAQFLLDNLEINFDTSLPYYEKFSQWEKYYTVAFIRGLLGDQSAITLMEKVAESSSQYKFDAITRLAEAGYYNHFESVNSNYAQNEKSNMYVYSLYGNDSRYRATIREDIEAKARVQDNYIDINSYALYIANFDYPLFVEILNDHFENSTGEEKFDTFFHLGTIDFDGQPNRTIVGLENEINDTIRERYIPLTSFILESNLESKKYLEPEFVHILQNISIEPGGLTFSKRTAFMKQIKPPMPEDSFPTSKMFKKLVSYTEECFKYEWVSDLNFKKELIKIAETAENYFKSNELDLCFEEINKFNLSVEIAYSSSGSDRVVSAIGYKYLKNYSEYILNRLK